MRRGGGPIFQFPEGLELGMIQSLGSTPSLGGRGPRVIGELVGVIGLRDGQQKGAEQGRSQVSMAVVRTMQVE